MEDTDLKMLRDKCLLFNQFLIERMGMPAFMFQETNKLLEKAYQVGNKKVLNAGSRDIDMQISHMPWPATIELKKIFQEKLSINLEVVDKERIKAVIKVLKKGKISSPTEYELLVNRVDEIYADTSKVEEVKKINDLLAAYHK